MTKSEALKVIKGMTYFEIAKVLSEMTKHRDEWREYAKEYAGVEYWGDLNIPPGNPEDQLEWEETK